MKFIDKTIRNTFADKFKRYSFVVFVVLATVFVLTSPIDNGYHDQGVEQLDGEQTVSQESSFSLSDETLAPSTIFELPFIGSVDAKNFSLPFLAVVLGLVDGLNPCAMWVLLYLISLVITMNDRRRIWLVVGSFILASGSLYFLFMTAWLNAFLLMGYTRVLTVIIGCFSLWVGTVDIYESIKNRGQAVCQVGDSESKSGTMEKIKKAALAPFTFGGLLAIVSLAFVVNSVEFLCSAGIPAIYTHILSISHLSTIQYYFYISMYVFFFMLDDLVIFSTAAFAATSSLGQRYAAYTKPIGGVIMLAIGIILVFFPTVLR